MANIIGVSFFTFAIFVAWFLGAAMANDGACAIAAFHYQPFKFVEQLLLLCWLV